MKRHETTLFDKLRQFDIYILIPAVILTVFGIVVLSSAVNYMGENNLVTVQILASTIGFFTMVCMALIDYDSLLKKLAIPMFLASCALLILPIAKDIPNMLHGSFGNNDSWIALPVVGVNLQPAEVVKIIFIMTFGYHLGILKQGNINSLKGLAAICMHGGIIMVCVMLEMDLGALISFGLIFAVMCFCAGLSIWYFAAAGGVLVIISPIMWKVLNEYQRMRILVGFDPMQDPEGYGYQVLQSMRAIANGGVSGCGYASGTITQSTYESTLPARHTDMIFAVLCEDFGFIGALFYFLLMAVMIFRILIIARRNRDNYGMFICTGVATVFIFQTLENIGMCLGMLPVIGITLPFISYGGSSIVSLYMCLGAVMSVGVHRKKQFIPERKGHRNENRNKMSARRI